jgi:hypothetical protein
VARYGEEDSAYSSGLGSSLPELLAAQLMAVKKGFLKIEDIQVAAVWKV